MREIRRCGFRLLLACSFFGACDGIFHSALHAETRTAASLTPEAVSEAIHAAKDGDTVQLPAGTAVWTKGWNTGRGAKMKAVVIRGAGLDKTVICDHRSSRGSSVPFELHGVQGRRRKASTVIPSNCLTSSCAITSSCSRTGAAFSSCVLAARSSRLPARSPAAAENSESMPQHL